MNMVQTSNEVNGSGLIPPALEAYLCGIHARAVELQAIATALEVLLETGIADDKITGNLASVVVGIVSDVQRGLDIAAIDRVLA